MSLSDSTIAEPEVTIDAHARDVAVAERAVDRLRRRLDGGRLVDRRCRHGDYDRRAALGAGPLNIAAYTLLPFGQRAVSRAEYTGREDVGTGLLGFMGNLVWLVLAGWWLALGHLVTALLLAVTIIGIPFAWAHLKLAGIALWPIGKMIVPA